MRLCYELNISYKRNSFVQYILISGSCFYKWLFEVKKLSELSRNVHILDCKTKMTSSNDINVGRPFYTQKQSIYYFF